METNCPTVTISDAISDAIASEIVKVLHLGFFVAAPLSGPKKVEKHNQTPFWTQIRDLYP